MASTALAVSRREESKTGLSKKNEIESFRPWRRWRWPFLDERSRKPVFPLRPGKSLGFESADTVARRCRGCPRQAVQRRFDSKKKNERTSRVQTFLNFPRASRARVQTFLNFSRASRARGQTCLNFKNFRALRAPEYKLFLTLRA